MRIFASLAFVAGCGHVVADHAADGGLPSDGVAPDAPVATPRCDPAKPFGTPTLVPAVNSADDEIGFALARDELTAFIDHAYETPMFGSNLLVARRATAIARFETPTEAWTEQLNIMDGDEFMPFPSRDTLALYFARQYIPGEPLYVIAATRADTASAYTVELNVRLAGSLVTGTAPVLSSDERTLYHVDNQIYHLRAATRGASPDAIVDERDMSTGPIFNPVLSADELTLYYSTGAEVDILAATRPDRNTAFGTGIPVPNVNSAENDAPAFLTVDGCVLYLKSNRPGGVGRGDIWEARRAP